MLLKRFILILETPVNQVLQLPQVRNRPIPPPPSGPLPDGQQVPIYRPPMPMSPPPTDTRLLLNRRERPPPPSSPPPHQQLPPPLPPLPPAPLLPLQKQGRRSPLVWDAEFLEHFEHCEDVFDSAYCVLIIFELLFNNMPLAFSKEYMEKFILDCCNQVLNGKINWGYDLNY